MERAVRFDVFFSVIFSCRDCSLICQGGGPGTSLCLQPAWHLVKQLLHKLYCTRNQVLLYLWVIKPILKRSIFSSYYFRDCINYILTYQFSVRRFYQTLTASFSKTAVRNLLKFCQGTLLIMIFVKSCIRKVKTNHTF